MYFENVTAVQNVLFRSMNVTVVVYHLELNYVYLLFSKLSNNGLIGEGKLSYELYETEGITDKIRSRKMLI